MVYLKEPALRTSLTSPPSPHPLPLSPSPPPTPDDIPMNVSLGSSGVIPGMGPDDRVGEEEAQAPETIPGFELDGANFDRYTGINLASYMKMLTK